MFPLVIRATYITMKHPPLNNHTYEHSHMNVQFITTKISYMSSLLQHLRSETSASTYARGKSKSLSIPPLHVQVIKFHREQESVYPYSTPIHIKSSCKILYILLYVLMNVLCSIKMVIIRYQQLTEWSTRVQ